MTHEEMRLQLDAYVDGELALPEARTLEAHLQTCSECARLHELQRQLGTAIRREISVYQVPPDLRFELRRRLQSAAGIRDVRPGQRALHWRAAALAAGLALAALGGWGVGRHQAGDTATQEQILASHVRSLMPGHLTDVVSSDQHTVKPWFNGKLDFSPPVYDFAGRGYPLLGGRIDYVHGRAVAVLVYQRRRHLINVYLWPRTHGASGERMPVTRQGYHLLHGTTGGYVYWMVSDLGVSELSEFAGLVRQEDSSTGP